MLGRVCGGVLPALSPHSLRAWSILRGAMLSHQGPEKHPPQVWSRQGRRATCMEANRNKKREGIREAVRRGGKQVGDPHRGFRRHGATIPEERQNLIRGDLGASRRGEREEVGTEVQVLMEERRGRGRTPQTRAETLTPTCNTWVRCAPTPGGAV